MVISQPQENNPSYYYRASPTLPQLLWILPETPYVLYMQLQHQVTHRNGAIKHIFFTRIRSTEGSSAGVLYSFCRSMHALHLAVKILYKIFHVWKIWALTLHTSVGCISSRMPAGPHFVTQPILLSENIPNIWHVNHQQNTRRSDQIETIKR